MNELSNITVTVTRIEYGFDESEFEKEGVNEHCIKGERTIVKNGWRSLLRPIHRQPNLVDKLNSNEDIAMVAVELGEFVIATTGECAMAYAMAVVKGKFNDCTIEIIK